MKDQATFEAAVLPAIKWLCENTNPHASILITPTTAELLEGAMVVETKAYLRD